MGVSVIENVDPNPDNFVSAGIINTKTALIGCLLRLEPNKDKNVSTIGLFELARSLLYVCILWYLALQADHPNI